HIVHARLCPPPRPTPFPYTTLFRSLGRLEEAKACYADALRLNDDLPITSNNMGQALQEEGQLDEALAWYQRALQRAPNSARIQRDRKSTRLNSSHLGISYAVFCLKK